MKLFTESIALLFGFIALISIFIPSIVSIFSFFICGTLACLLLEKSY